jgi:pimeloyl-ACP methyl ester carboxylesterase
MPRFHHGTVDIAYLDEGEGEPIVLVHGFASNKEAHVPCQSPTLAGRNRPVMPAIIK